MEFQHYTQNGVHISENGDNVDQDIKMALFQYITHYGAYIGRRGKSENIYPNWCTFIGVGQMPYALMGQLNTPNS